MTKVAGMTNKQKKLNWMLRFTQHDVKKGMSFE
jgi:hypothetical protein